MSTEDPKVKRRQEQEAERDEERPIRRPSEGDDWEGGPSDAAERQRGEGRGLDEPEKKAPPDELA